MFEFLPMNFSNRNWLRRMDREFSELDRMFRSLERQSMRCDVEDLGDRFEMCLELPGMKKEDIQMTVRDNILVIRAEHKEETTHEEAPEIKAEKAADGDNVPAVQKEREAALSTDRRHFIHRERSYQSMERSFNVEEIQVDKITAKYENGVLTVVLPKKNPTKPEENIHTVEIE